MSVDFPAPFSPSRACTSPRRRSKSTLSFAVSAPKRLVTPFSSRASGVGCPVRLPLDLGRDVLISPALIFSSCSSTWSLYFAPSAFVLPKPTPLDFASKIVSVPALNDPSWTSWTVVNTASSIFFSAEVMIWSPR